VVQILNKPRFITHTTRLTISPPHRRTTFIVCTETIALI